MPDPLQALTLHPIGTMRTSFVTRVEAPRQPAAATDSTGIIELFADRNLEHAIEDLAGWERIWVIFWFDRNPGWRPKVLPPRSNSGRKGVLATRSPHRPNPLGLSVLRLERIEGLNLHVRDVDLLDGTPILDIKPYVAYTDAFADSVSGWLDSPADPAPSYAVTFSATAEEQLAWIAKRSELPLRDRVVSTLTLGPQPHPYRRIKRINDGSLQLAVQDWRISFSVAGQNVEVTELRSGYRRSQLDQAEEQTGSAAFLHRQFMSHFGLS